MASHPTAASLRIQFSAHPQCSSAGVHSHIHAQQHIVQQLHHPLACVVGVIQVGGPRRFSVPTACLQAAT